MSFALVFDEHKETANSDNATTDAVDSTGANLIVIAASAFGVGPDLVVTDSESNTWTPLTASSSSGFNHVKLFYCFNPTTDAAHTFTIDTTSDFPAISVQGWSGAVTSPFDQEDDGNTGSGSAIPCGTITPSENDCLVVAAAAENDGLVTVVNESMTITGANANSSGVGLVMAYKVQTSAAAISPSFTVSGGTDGAGTVASFKAAGGGPTSILPLVAGEKNGGFSTMNGGMRG